MPYASDDQKRFMEAVRHGWTPDHMKAPPKSVAEKMHRDDKGAMKRKMMAKALREMQ